MNARLSVGASAPHVTTGAGEERSGRRADGARPARGSDCSNPPDVDSDVLIYFLAAREDEAYVKEIRTHLGRSSGTTRARSGCWTISTPAGTDLETHKKQLLEADIVLSLVSADFIDDDEVYDRNQSVLDRYNRGETKMISILVRNCLWKDSPLAKFQLLPTNSGRSRAGPARTTRSCPS